MGNDGGSIPKRREVVKERRKEERKEQFEIAKAKSRLCAISKEPLKKPLAFCRLGLLYNKEEVLKRMLEKTMPTAFRHIRKLKQDLRDVKADFKHQPDEEVSMIVCPISKREMNGFHHFLGVWSCGCLLSEEAARELKMSDACLVCGVKIEKKSDIIGLNQTREQQEAQYQRACYLNMCGVYMRMLDEKVKQEKEEKVGKLIGKRVDRNEEAKDPVQTGGAGEIDRKEEIPEEEKNKRAKKSEAYKSLFKPMYEEDTERDFLCRNVHRGLR